MAIHCNLKYVAVIAFRKFVITLTIFVVLKFLYFLTFLLFSIFTCTFPRPFPFMSSDVDVINSIWKMQTICSYLQCLGLRLYIFYYYIPRNLFLYTINPNVSYERWISGAISHGHGISQCSEIHLTFEWSNVMFTFLVDTENGENLSN